MRDRMSLDARATVRAFAREPLVHFLVLGALLAALESLAATEEPATETRTLIVDADTRSALADELLHELERTPTEAELRARVDAWVDEELLYREGLARGLDRDDARVRQRIATLTASLLEARHPIEEPSEEALRAHFEANLTRYAEDARIDFVHVFVEGLGEESEARAATLLAQLRAGASPIGLGDVYPGGRHYRGRRLNDLAESFGDAFTEGLDRLGPGEWVLRRSRTGLHIVRVEHRSAASPADLERARLDVTHDVVEAARAARREEVRRELRARWRVIER